MRSLLLLLGAEGLKLRRSAALRAVWLLPTIFLAVEWLLIERPALGIHAMTPKLQSSLDGLQLKTLVGLWAGFFHPLLVAIVPALIFRPEHRFKTWRRLHAMPTSRRGIFLVKGAYTLALTAASLAILGLLMRVEHGIMGGLNPLLATPFQPLKVMRLLGWLWLGSLPVLAVYLWVSDRINSLAVPIVFGFLGLLLTVALTGQELPQPWRRDLIPWVLPYACAEQVVHEGRAQQAFHPAAAYFQTGPDVLRLPSGKRVKTWQNVPDDVLFPPPPPTPSWLLASFSLGAGFLLFLLGWADAAHDRR